MTYGPRATKRPKGSEKIGSLQKSVYWFPYLLQLHKDLLIVILPISVPAFKMFLTCFFYVRIVRTYGRVFIIEQGAQLSTALP